MVDKAVNAICLPVLFVISVPSNALNMAVFAKQGLRERVNLCLFCLSLADFLHVFKSFMNNVDRLDTSQSVPGPVLEFLIKYKLFAAFQGVYWLSGFVSMVIACERCLCVVSPLRSQTILKTRTTAVILLTGTLIIMATSTVVSLGWSLACMFDPVANVTSTVIYTGEFYVRNKAYLDVLTLVLITVQPFLFVTVVLATTVVTTVKLQRMVTWREKTSSCVMTSREMALTRTLIAVSGLYIVCSIPTMVIGIGVVFVPDFSLSGKYYNLVKVVTNTMWLASYVNATVNFLVYCFLGSRFRQTLRELFGCTTSIEGKSAKRQVT